MKLDLLSNDWVFHILMKTKFVYRDIFMQYTYLCNTHIYAIHIFMQYTYLCNTHIYAIHIKASCCLH